MRLRLLWQILGTVTLLASITVSALVGLFHFTIFPQTHRAAPVAHTLPGLSVKGTEILTDDRRPITLIGATRSSLEYQCTGDGHFRAADFAAMRAWGMNVVRFTLSSEFWANHDATCPAYRETVRDAVATAEAQGLYVILDLQWNAPFDLRGDRSHGGAQCPLPDAHQDVAFWQDLASIFRNDRHVLFDLYGEPHNISWSTWYYGGTITNGCNSIISWGHANIERGRYTAIGMRDLVALVHAIAPENTLVVSGLDWGYDLSLVKRYPLATTNLLYDTHPFAYGDKQPGYWDSAFGDLAQHAAVIAGEFGSYDCKTAYSAQAIAYFTAHHMSWLAWAWNPSTCVGPTLIADWSGKPTIPYGAYIHQQMLVASKSNDG
jgi:endoglucanase